MTEPIRAIFETTLRDEPPLVDIVTGAVEGARRKQRRDRIAVAASPLALVVAGIGAYAVLPGFGSSAGRENTPASMPYSTKYTHPPFPPVAADKPVNATPATHQEAVRQCTKDWSKFLAPLSSNSMPNTQQQAVDMCVMTGETLMTLMPTATVTLATVPEASMPNGPGEQWVVATTAGKTQIGIKYLWPDSAYEKKHYGPFDECQPNPLHNPTETLAPGPDNKPFPMLDHNAGHDQYCVQSRPAQQFYGALTLDYTNGTLSYSVVNHDYGRYLIGTSVIPIPVSTKPTSGSYEMENGQYIVPGSNVPAAMDLGQLGNALLDPRFNDFLIRYEKYVLTHATAASFGVSGSKPLS